MSEIFNLIERKLAHLYRLPCATANNLWAKGYQAALADVERALQEARAVAHVVEDK